MAESTDNLAELAQKTWQRRGLFAALWAAAVGFVLKKTTQVVQATAFPVQGSNDPTQIFPSIVSSPIFLGAQTNSGTSYENVILNVYGDYFNSASNALTHAIHARAMHGTAVTAWTTGSGIPISAQVTNGFAAMWGSVADNGDGSSVAVYGQNGARYAGSSPGGGGFGVYGNSLHGHGVVGTTAAAGAGAVVGNAYGVAGAWAGIFYGPVYVAGDFTVTGAKSAAVPHPDGSHRRLYCVESPESWFEDFGESELACGEATVAIDPDFAAVTRLDGYHVFLTAYGDFELHVSDRAPTGFRVRAKDTTASGRFSWRVVAKRKDIASPRFERVTVPPKPEMPTIPEPPAIPTPPVMRRHH